VSAIFVGGTASHVGKSWMTTAICRHLVRRGLRVAPFKAQNMSNNSYPCAGGLEIGRAQVAQAEACNLDPEPDMNPVLLKPTSSSGSQVIVNGKLWQNLSASDYYQHTAALREAALAAYHRLAARFDVIVIEGAGSVAELNLKSRDIVNLSMARAANAKALLVGDIDRGGIFASILGTLSLLDPEERALVQAFAVNRFRGDPTLFRDGVDILEQGSGCPALGVFPMVEGQSLLDAEDSVTLDEAPSDPDATIAIIRLPRTSNFTDFRLLRAAWITRPVSKPFEWIILPGTKNTIGDLEWLRQTGLDLWIQQQQDQGANVLGICGGYQMLGLSIDDPHAMESPSPRTIDGLGLLPIRTVLDPHKSVRTVSAKVGNAEAGAYEIHLGRTWSEQPDLPPFALIDGNRPEGLIKGSPTTAGTYLHGILEHPQIAQQLFGSQSLLTNHHQQDRYDALAIWFEQNANLTLFEERFL
jgi:adenosylcobyric acid synthase